MTAICSCDYSVLTQVDTSYWFTFERGSMCYFTFCSTKKEVEHLLSFPKCKIDQNCIIKFYSILKMEKLLKWIATMSLRGIKYVADLIS